MYVLSFVYIGNQKKRRLSVDDVADGPGEHQGEIA